jgi:hypothetical protein
MLNAFRSLSCSAVAGFRISDGNGKAKLHCTLVPISLLECDLLAHKLGQFIFGCPMKRSRGVFAIRFGSTIVLLPEGVTLL